MREKNICRINEEHEVGPSAIAKMNGMCNECFANPPGTSVATLLEKKEIKFTQAGLVRVTKHVNRDLVEHE